jgi:hypothetical protein
MRFIKSIKHSGGSKCSSYKKNKPPKCGDQSGCKWIVKQGCKYLFVPKKKVATPKKRVANPAKKLATPKKRVTTPKKRVANPKRVTPKKRVATPKKSQKQQVFPKIKLDKHSLGKHGYKHTETLTENQRHNSINSAIGEYGAKPVLGKIGLLRTLHKYKKPKLSRKYYDNMVWLREKYDGPPHFKQPYEKSALFRK